MERISNLEKEIAEIRETLHLKEKELYDLKKEWFTNQQNYVQTQQIAVEQQSDVNSGGSTKFGDRLPKWAIERYSRQILLPQIGVLGQEKLCKARVLVVGAGGLGCPAALYLAGAGVGEIGIVDYDTVDLTNIHRQVLHGESDQNVSKVESAAYSLRNINSRIRITPYNLQLDSSNALEVVSKYDLILDCTDNVPTRYLLNDACVLTKLPLISGSALKMDGQITIYGYRASRNANETEPSYIGPCYRCVFPSPPPAETVASCSANGVAGPVPGIIGALQALEAIKYIIGQTYRQLSVERMLLFDGEDMTFRMVKLRPQHRECAACSANPSITKLLDYEAFCKSQAKEKKRQEAERRTNALVKTQNRKAEKERRMTGQSYLGFRQADPNCKRKWIQDVPKSERKIGPHCRSKYCQKLKRTCSVFDENIRKEIFNHFWNELDWKGKKKYVRTLIDNVPPKRRTVNDRVSRRGDNRLYHLFYSEKRMSVCRILFLNTLGIKEAMVRWWLVKQDSPKASKKPIKSINVDSYIAGLPLLEPKCQYCKNSSNIKYISLNGVKNLFQLYQNYVKDMKMGNVSPASRKTFTKVFYSKNVRFFKSKSGSDICDLVVEHNTLPNVNYQHDNLIIQNEYRNDVFLECNFDI